MSCFRVVACCAPSEGSAAAEHSQLLNCTALICFGEHCTDLPLKADLPQLQFSSLGGSKKVSALKAKAQLAGEA